VNAMLSRSRHIVRRKKEISAAMGHRKKREVSLKGKKRAGISFLHLPKKKSHSSRNPQGRERGDQRRGVAAISHEGPSSKEPWGGKGRLGEREPGIKELLAKVCHCSIQQKRKKKTN